MSSDEAPGRPASRRPSVVPGLRGVLWVLLARVVIVTFLLGLGAWFELQVLSNVVAPRLLSIYLLIALSYFVTAISLLVARALGSLVAFTYFQLLWDALFTTTVVYLTGGSASVFILLYCFAIIYASVLLDRLGWVVSATLCTLCYAALLSADQLGWLPPFQASPWGAEDRASLEAYYSIIIYSVAFYCVGGFTHYLSRQVRETGRVLQEKQIDYAELATLTSDILQSLGTGLLTVDRDGHITSFNRAAERITGKRFADLYGRPLETVLPEFRLPPTRRADMSAPQQWDGVYRSDGRPCYLGFSLTALHNGFGEEAGLVLSFQDITPLKELEADLRRSDRLAATGELAAGLAHEVRNPLASMSGSIQMLRESPELTPSSERLMGIVLREMERLEGLIANFLLFARPSPTDMRPFGLTVLIDETADLLRHHPEAAGVEIRTEVEPGLKVVADVEQLRQVLWNLMLNAVQAMKGRGGELKVRARSEGAGVVLEVEDTGPGVAPEVADRIFDPFFTTKEKGSGLGLSVVHRIIEANRGRIQLAAGASGGALFRIRLTSPTAAVLVEG